MSQTLVRRRGQVSIATKPVTFTATKWLRWPSITDPCSYNWSLWTQQRHEPSAHLDWSAASWTTKWQNVLTRVAFALSFTMLRHDNFRQLPESYFQLNTRSIIRDLLNNKVYVTERTFAIFKHKNGRLISFFKTAVYQTVFLLFIYLAESYTTFKQLKITNGPTLHPLPWRDTF